MLEIVEQRAVRNPHIPTLCRHVELLVRVDGAGEPCHIRLSDDGVKLDQAPQSSADLVLEASADAWEKHFSAVPPPGFQTLSAMRRVGHLVVSGRQIEFYRNLLLLELLFSLDVDPGAAASGHAFPPPGTIENVVGRYLHLELDGRMHRVYFEEAGSGIPLVCLHTAGADGRQYRALLNDPEVTAKFRVIAFDMPWHGKSSPPAGFGNETYRLTTDGYVGFVMAFCAALKLDDPVVMGCSIGGRAVLHLALRHGESFRAAIGLQSATYAENSVLDEAELTPLNRGDVHAGRLAGASMASLTAPRSPHADRWETMWHYMQGGPGIFLGDLHYYFSDGDLRNGALNALDVEKCPVYLLTGEYDYSATPEMTLELAREINATHCEIMQDMGHFPMSENPLKFREYLLPVLERIAA